MPSFTANLSALLIGSHILAFTFGAVSCWLLVRSEADPEKTRGEDMYRKDGEGRLHWTGRGLFVIFVLVASLVMIGFGAQQWFYQRDASRRDACYATWGQGVIDTITARTEAQKALEAINQSHANALAKVNARHDAALDKVTLDFLGLTQKPPTVTVHQTSRDLVKFSKVKVRGDTELARLKKRDAKALANLNQTRQENPYPQLNCD